MDVLVVVVAFLVGEKKRINKALDNPGTIPQEFSVGVCFFFSFVFSLPSLEEGPNTGKLLKAVRRGCKRSFGPKKQRSPKSLMPPYEPCFAPVQFRGRVSA